MTASEPSIYTDAFHLILACSEANSPKAFIRALLAQLSPVCPYDQAVVFFFDRNNKIADFYTEGTREGWLDLYLNYYIGADVIGMGLRVAPPNENESGARFTIIDWDKLPDSEFKREYIDPVNLKHTLSFSLFDMSGATRAIVCLDRRARKPFREEELALLKLTMPVLVNMHRNFFYKDVENVDTASLWQEYRLTAREAEIAEMLCQGMRAARIGATLFITEATAHKHIAHIYRKVGVSSQQELIARMLSRRSLL